MVNRVSLQLFKWQSGGGNFMCVCQYQKSVCKVTVPKVCTVGIYSKYESRYLYSLGEYICLLKNKFNIHVIYYLYI